MRNKKKKQRKSRTDTPNVFDKYLSTLFGIPFPSQTKTEKKGKKMSGSKFKKNMAFNFNNWPDAKFTNFLDGNFEANTADSFSHQGANNDGETSFGSQFDYYS